MTAWPFCVDDEGDVEGLRLGSTFAMVGSKVKGDGATDDSSEGPAKVFVATLRVGICDGTRLIGSDNDTSRVGAAVGVVVLYSFVMAVVDSNDVE